jgi:predicted esterase
MTNPANAMSLRWVSRLVVVVVVAFFAVAVRAATPAAATRPVTPEQAILRSNIALANLLLDEPTDDQLRHLGNRYRAGGDFMRAIVLHLTALRGDPDDPEVEYDLACDFAFARENKLGIKYLQRAADHGYWGYRIVTEDTDVNPLKSDAAFGPALAKIKASFEAQAPRHAPGMTVTLPKGAAPAGGWPVVFFLHGFASSRHDFVPEAQFVSTLGYVGVTLDGTQVMGPSAYTWDRKSTEVTHHQVQAGLKSFKFPIDRKRVYLQGFSQGGMHAVRLLADHPDVYAGCLANSPGSAWLIPTRLVDGAHTGALVLSLGNQEDPTITKSVGTLEALWKSAGRPVHVIHFEGGHQFPPDPEKVLRTALEQLGAVK